MDCSLIICVSAFSGMCFFVQKKPFEGYLYFGMFWVYYPVCSQDVCCHVWNTFLCMSFSGF